MIEGPSGVVCYGEITPSRNVKVGSKIRKSYEIGTVKRVLKEGKERPDIPGHSTSMLHLELYKKGTRNFAHWSRLKKDPNLLDPTPYLINSKDFNGFLPEWENEKGEEVG